MAIRWHEIQVYQPKQGNYAYLLHIVRSLKRTGTGACILPHEVLFRGNAEAALRKNLIREDYIKGIIGLPPNLFHGTDIPACIIVVDNREAAERHGIFMADASDGFIKDGPKSRLRSQDIEHLSFATDCSDNGFLNLSNEEPIEPNTARS